jgi:hypothetical protein
MKQQRRLSSGEESWRHPAMGRYMRMGGNEQHAVVGEGTAVLIGGPQGDILLKNAQLVPIMIHNIVSSGLVATAGYRVVLEGTDVRIVRPRDSTTILAGVVGEGMFQLSARLQVQKSQQVSLQVECNSTAASDGVVLAARSAIPVQLAHERLGHISVDHLKKVAASDAVTGLNLSDPTAMPDACIACNETKQTRASFPPSESRASKPLEIVHIDTIGPITPTAFDGSRYAVPIHDDYSLYSDIISVAGKDEIAE